MEKPFVVGIAGGTGSGKSTLAGNIKRSFAGDAHVIHLDNYFISKEKMPVFAGESNYDDPKSVDFKTLVTDITSLIDEKSSEIIIVEGFLVLYSPEVRKLLNLSIFLMAPAEVIINRRIHEASDHYRSNVIKPMYEQYVIPSAQYADLVLDVVNQNEASILEEAIKLLRGKTNFQFTR